MEEVLIRRADNGGYVVHLTDEAGRLSVKTFRTLTEVRLAVEAFFDRTRELKEDA